MFLSTASLLTPPGVAAIAVVALRGPLVGDFCRKHLNVAPDARPRHAVLTDGPDVLDDPLVLRRHDGSVELHLHGGRYVVARTLELAEAAGLTPADPPAGDTIEEQVAAALPRALTRTAVRLLLDQPRRWREQGGPTDDPTLAVMLSVPRLALVGPPNAGKSTLANRLLGRDRFITADQPGTTRDWAEELADLNGLPARLTDTPGRRATADPIESAAITNSLAVAADLTLCVTAPDAPDFPAPPGSLEVWNKSDLAPPPPGRLGVSAATGRGTDALLAAIHRHFGVNVYSRRPMLFLSRLPESACVPGVAK